MKYIIYTIYDAYKYFYYTGIIKTGFTFLIIDKFSMFNDHDHVQIAKVMA